MALPSAASRVDERKGIMKPSLQSKILMIGNDPALVYLIARYAEQSGYAIQTTPILPSAAEARALHPAAILFQSVEGLETSQMLIADLANDDVFVLVCSSVTDEARARELGADHCLLHPLTYENVLAALSATNAQA
jgi:DNA-binding response OmpR family regulator